MKEIKSNSNPLIKRVRKLLSQNRYRLNESSLVVEGIHAVYELLNSNKHDNIEQIIISDKFDKDIPKLTHSKCIKITHELFNDISDVEHSQGIMCIASYKPSEFNFKLYSRVLLLDQINNPGNLGTLIRTAVAAGFEAILLTEGCVDITNPKVIRSTMGTFFKIPLFVKTISEISSLKDNGFSLVTSIPSNGLSIYEYKFKTPYIITVGSESHGTSDKLIELSDQLISIPMENNCESLNAAIAGGIIMFNAIKK